MDGIYSSAIKNDSESKLPSIMADSVSLKFKFQRLMNVLIIE